MHPNTTLLAMSRPWLRDGLFYYSANFVSSFTQVSIQAISRAVDGAMGISGSSAHEKQLMFFCAIMLASRIAA